MAGNVRYRSGAWRIQVYAGTDPITGRKKRVARTVHAPNNRAGRKLADEALATLLLEVAARGTAIADDITVAELLQRWIASRTADWAPSTVRGHRQIVDTWITPRIGHRRLRKLRAVDIDAMYADLRAHGGRNRTPLSAGTVRRIHTVLHSACNQAVRWGLITTNPATIANKPTVEPHNISPPNPTDVARAITEADPDFALWVRVSATTGARRGQIAALRWDDLDLDAGTITFARAISIGTGELVEKGTKTGRIYTVSVDPGTIALLATRRADWYRQVLAEPSLPKNGFVFARPDGRCWHPTSASHAWRTLRDTVGLPNVRLHDLRHHVATEMLAAGADVRTVAHHLGHANPSTTLNVYAAFVPALDRAASDGLGARLDQAMPTVSEPTELAQEQ